MTPEQSEVIFMEHQSVSYLAGFQAIIDAVRQEEVLRYASRYLDGSKSEGFIDGNV